MNLNTNLAKREDTEKTCGFLNQRFGYRKALEAVLVAHGVDMEVIRAMSGLARDRQFDSFNELLQKHVHPKAAFNQATRQ